MKEKEYIYVSNLVRLLQAKALISECMWHDEEQKKEMNKIINFIQDETDKLFDMVVIK